MHCYINILIVADDFNFLKKIIRNYVFYLSI